MDRQQERDSSKCARASMAETLDEALPTATSSRVSGMCLMRRRYCAGKREAMRAKVSVIDLIDEGAALIRRSSTACSGERRQRTALPLRSAGQLRTKALRLALPPRAATRRSQGRASTASLLSARAESHTLQRATQRIAAQLHLSITAAWSLRTERVPSKQCSNRHECICHQNVLPQECIATRMYCHQNVLPPECFATRMYCHHTSCFACPNVLPPAPAACWHRMHQPPVPLTRTSSDSFSRSNLRQHTRTSLPSPPALATGLRNICSTCMYRGAQNLSNPNLPCLFARPVSSRCASALRDLVPPATQRGDSARQSSCIRALALSRHRRRNVRARCLGACTSFEIQRSERSLSAACHDEAPSRSRSSPITVVASISALAISSSATCETAHEAARARHGHTSARG
eukprot:3446593-Pleurochrysis_carterae.AAC.2